jgi:hypothetical protein
MLENPTEYEDISSAEFIVIFRQAFLDSILSVSAGIYQRALVDD